jgi:hypothetical protein
VLKIVILLSYDHQTCYRILKGISDLELAALGIRSPSADNAFVAQAIDRITDIRYVSSFWLFVNSEGSRPTHRLRLE